VVKIGETSSAFKIVVGTHLGDQEGGGREYCREVNCEMELSGLNCGHWWYLVSALLGLVFYFQRSTVKPH
jgi:hypothetical protein